MATISMARLFLAAALLASPEVQAATFVVNDTADVVDATPGDGVCETAVGNGTCTLRAAILEANALAGADAVTLPPGIYSITTGLPSMGGDTPAVADFDVTGDLQIAGGGPGVSIIEGNYEMEVEELDRVIQIAAGATVSISGVTIRRGSITIGAGILNDGTLALSDCEIRENTSGYYPTTNPAAGICNGGTATITRCEITENVAWGDGGGIANGGTLVIEDSAVHANVAVSGGGIINGGTLTIRNSTITANTAHGIYNHSLIVLEGAGAGILDAGGSATLEHTTVSGNIIDSVLPIPGGFIFPDYYGTGAGLGVANGVTTVGFTLRSTIVAGNTHDYGSAPDDDCGTPAPTSLGHNLDGDGTCMLTGTGDLPSTDPALGPLTDNGGPTPTRAIPAGSAAIDAADPDECPAADQRGAPRPDGACDIGAYESTLPCGDGDVDAGEQCDDGSPGAGDCCSFLCQYEPGSTTCDLDGDPCTDDRCSAGACVPTTTIDCDVCETCLGNGCVAGPRALCRNPFGDARSTLILKPDSLVWRWSMGEATSADDFGDPTTTDDYGLCMFDHLLGPLEPVNTRIDATLLGGALCGGVPCWIARGQPPGSRGLRYRDRQGAQAGIEKIVMRPGLDGQSRILVKAKGPALGFTEPLDVQIPTVVQLQRDDGACWEATFTDVVTYQSDLVKLRSEP